MKLWWVRGSRTGVEQVPVNKGLGTVSQGQGVSLRPTRESQSQTFPGGMCSAFRLGPRHSPPAPRLHPISLLSGPLAPLDRGASPSGSGLTWEHTCLPGLQLWSRFSPQNCLSQGRFPQPLLQQGLLNALLAPGLVFQDIYVHSFTF